MPIDSNAKQGYQTIQLQNSTPSSLSGTSIPSTSIVMMSVPNSGVSGTSHSKINKVQSSQTGDLHTQTKPAAQTNSLAKQQQLETKVTAVRTYDDVPSTKKMKRAETSTTNRREDAPLKGESSQNGTAGLSKITAIKINDVNTARSTNTTRSIAPRPSAPNPFRPATTATFQPINRPIPATAAASPGSTGIRLDSVGSKIHVDLRRPSAPVQHLRKRKRSVTFAESVMNRSTSPPIGSTSHQKSQDSVSHLQLIPTTKHEKRRLKNALKCARDAVTKMELALRESKLLKSDGSPTNQISSTVELISVATTNQQADAISSAPQTSTTVTPSEAQHITLNSTQARTPPVAIVTLHNACRFYRCQSVAHPNAVLGMIRSCRLCRGNYTVACGNIVTGRCNLNLADVECPKCWNANACYCGEPFSDRYIGGREV